MQAFSLLTVFLVLFSTNIQILFGNVATPHRHSHQESHNCRVDPKIYNISLDSDPHHRWDHLIADFPNMRNDSLEVLYAALKREGIPNEIVPWLNKIAAAISTMIPEPFRSELEGIADRLDIDIGFVTMMNIGYDFSAYCTSIVASDKDGQIWHGRNLDYNGTSTLRNNTVHLNFQRNGQTLYSGVSFAGYIGLLTAAKPHAFSLTINERNKGSLIDNFLELLDPKVSWLGFDIRKVLDEAPTYSDAVDSISKLHMPGPVYIILGGLRQDEGAILTRSRRSTIDDWSIDNKNGRWYVLQTNYDRWEDVPWWDNRRIPGEKAMNATGQNGITKLTLFDVLSIPKVNNQYTVYTTIMSASDPGQMQTWVRC
jgi:N-acylethanolamine-hydrolysing acid amidase